MPRGKKQKMVVVFASPEDGGHILKHGYQYNHRNTDKAKIFSKIYDPKSRKHIAPGKIKDEKHSSGT